MSTHRFLAGLFLCASLHAQVSQSPFFHLRPPDGFQPAMAPIVPDWPQPQLAGPPSGFVSLRELQHPISKKAFRAAYEAQQFSQAHNSAKAIEKLKKAVHIDPSYRDAHSNLGVEYARARRFADARAEFQKALDIGQPAAPIYANLALTLIAAGEIREAQDLARKALELNPDNPVARRIAEANFQ